MPTVHAKLAELATLSAAGGERSALRRLESQHGAPRRRLSTPTGAECYTVSDGLPSLMGIGGNYERMDGPNAAERPFCGERSVYRNGEHYLLSDEPESGDSQQEVWLIASSKEMEACSIYKGGLRDIFNELAEKVAAYAITESQPDDPHSSGVPWMTRTGTGTAFSQCDTSDDPGYPYCPEDHFKVTKCSSAIHHVVNLAPLLVVSAASNFSALSAPVVRLSSNDTIAPRSEKRVPVVFLHGMGDSGSNPGMKSICKTASDKYPGLHSVCSNVANGMSSIATELHKQLDEFTAEVRADPKLKDGFTAVGLSQGNLVIRAYIEKINDPLVHKWVSICGPNNGIGTCPKNALYEAVCPLWKLPKYSAPTAFSDYWKDSEDESGYLAQSRFLADLNNEREQKNSTYRANMASLKKLVLVEAMNDTMVVPHASESFGFWKWGESGKHATVVPMRDTKAYAEDFIGLQTLDKAGKIDMLTYEGDHLQFSSDFWTSKILPYLGD